MIEYLKSSLSISAYAGCLIGCKYCILSGLGKDSIDKICDEEDLVDKLLAHKYFELNKTVVTVNNRTEPFLNPVISDSTLRILEILDAKRIKNPIYLITKWYVSEDILERLKKLKLNLFVFYTYSKLPKNVENLDNEKQLTTIKALGQLDNIKVVHYLRPIIKNYNDRRSHIEQILQEVKDHCVATIISGIRINSAVYESLKANNIDVTFDQTNTEHKIIDDDLIFYLLEYVKTELNGYKLFRNTSCALSTLMNIRDYNCNFNKRKYCSYCENRVNCFVDYSISEEHIERLLHKIDKVCCYEITEKHIYFNTVFSQEDIAFLKQHLGYAIKCKEVLKSPSEELLAV